MTSNVLPLFWNLASSSRDTRLTASVNLISSLEGFQSTFRSSHIAANGDASSEDEDDDDEEDNGDEFGMEVDDEEEDGERNDAQDEIGLKLDKKLARDNAEDVVYCLKRLIRGLGSSRESSRLGFAVALTEVGVLNDPSTITHVVVSAA
jgi:DNA polymerase phi